MIRGFFGGRPARTQNSYLPFQLPLNAGKKLTENEKRYLRGNMMKKLNVLEELEEKEATANSVSMLLSSISSYYITNDRKFLFRRGH